MRETVVDATREPFNVLVLGVQGENDATVIKFDYSKWIEEYGQGTFALIHKRAGEPEPEPVYITINNGIASWIVTSADTKSVGRGVAEATFRVDDVVIKTRRYVTNVTESISNIEDPTSNFQEILLQTAEANQAQMIAHDREFEQSQELKDQKFDEALATWSNEMSRLTNEANDLETRTIGISNRADEALADAISAKNEIVSVSTQAEITLERATEAYNASSAVLNNATIATSNAEIATSNANEKATMAESAALRANNLSNDLENKVSSGYFKGDRGEPGPQGEPGRDADTTLLEHISNKVSSISDSEDAEIDYPNVAALNEALSPVLSFVNNTVPIAKGGTGGTTAKAAQYNIMKDTPTSEYPLEGVTEILIKRDSPSSSLGYFQKISIETLWDYIKSRIDAEYIDADRMKF